jgi:hypothetical protein
MFNVKDQEKGMVREMLTGEAHKRSGNGKLKKGGKEIKVQKFV